ncbi:hypothetical protein [Massilia luteola]|nr:hypothetical protein [Massilia sp. Gc5]
MSMTTTPVFALALLGGHRHLSRRKRQAADRAGKIAAAEPLNR